MSAEIFDHRLLHLRRRRCRVDFLFDEVEKNLTDRLKDIRRDFKNILRLGPEQRGIETLDAAAQSLDLVISPFCLHWTNDLPGLLAQIRRTLKPDGLFLAGFPGGETLKELRQSLMQGELAVRGGFGPRVSPFVGLQDAAGLMQRAGFSLPVADRETLTVSYPDLRALLHDLRGMGESSALRQRAGKRLTRTVLAAAENHYRAQFGEKDGRLPASFEILYLSGWAPHESQQKPLKPGSAQHRLADALANGRD